MKHKIQLTVEMEVDGPTSLDRDALEFYYEVAKCGDDLVDQLAVEVLEAEKSGSCTCHRMSIKYLGPVN